MRVYIASQYQKKAAINKKIYDELRKENIDAFLPISINVDATASDPQEQRLVADTCRNEIRQCDVILGVWNFNRSVSCELGCAMECGGKKKKLVIYDTGDNDINILRSEVMIWPYVDKKVESISELIVYLKSLQ